MTDQHPPDPAPGSAVRTKRFAREILDALDAPTSSERLAYEEQKEREDRESLERFHRETGQRKETDADAAP